MKNVETEVLELAGPVAAGLGLELVEVEYRRKSGGMELTLFIDKPDGVGIDDCEALHREIDVLLDEHDISEGNPYTLGISSLGLDRPLKTEKDFSRNLNREIEIKLFAQQMGKKLFSGKLVSHTAHTVTLLIDGSEKTFEISKIALAQQKITF